MYLTKKTELPPRLKKTFRKAITVEWITLIYLISVVIVIYLVLGSSQALKAAWFEDIFALVPAISFLVASKIYNKKPTEEYPFGYHRVFSIAFLLGAFALLAMGLFLLFDSATKLIQMEHPTIATMSIFGYTFWEGWAMILALLYSAIPTYFIGKYKKTLASDLHNKILFTDADSQKADHLTAGAAIIGILGIGLGLWWADSLAAIFISLSIIRDGMKHLVTAITDLMDRYPQTIKKEKRDPLVTRIEKRVNSYSWIKKGKVRVRESGQIYFVEAQVIPKTDKNSVENIASATEDLKKIHWKIQDVQITLVKDL